MEKTCTGVWQGLWGETLEAARKKLLLLSLFLALIFPAMGQPGPLIRSVAVSPRYEPQPREPSGRILDLINKLGNPELDQRRSALMALVEMGPDVEPELRWATQHESPAITFPFEPEAVKTNCFLLKPGLRESRLKLFGIEEALSRVEEQRQLLPTKINLHCTNALLTNVLFDLGKQAQAEIFVGTSPWTPPEWMTTQHVTLDLQGASYWKAMQEIESRAGLGEMYETRNRPLLVPGMGRNTTGKKSEAEPCVISGPLRIWVASVESVNSLTYSDRSRTNRVRFILHAQAEPKFWNSGAQAKVKVEMCVDSRGKSLLAQPIESFMTNERHSCWTWEIPVELPAPAQGRRIKSLKGHFSVELQRDQRYLVVTNLLHARGEKRKLDALELSVSKVDSQREWDSVLVEISAPHNSPYARTFENSIDCCNLSVFDEAGIEMYVAPMHSAWVEVGVGLWDIFRGEEKLRAPQAGRQFHDVRQEADRDVMSWWLHFSRRVKPDTLLWLPPPGTRWFTVPFELHNLALP